MNHCALIRQIQYMEFGSMRRCIQAGSLLVAHVLVFGLMLGRVDLPLTGAPCSAQGITRTLQQGMCFSEACGIHFRRPAVQQVEVTHRDRAGLQFFSKLESNIKCRQT